MVSATDNFTAIANLVFSQVPLEGASLDPMDMDTVQVSVGDEAGKIAVCIIPVSFQPFPDASPPVISDCPADMDVSVNDDCAYVVMDYIGMISVIDDISDVDDIVITQSPNLGAVVLSSQEICLVATDLAGNSSSCCWMITASDDTAPEVQCPNDMNVTADGGGDYAIKDFVSDITVADNCTSTADLLFSQSPISGTVVSGIGTTQEIVIAVLDANGNGGQCSFDITLE